jgi:hypothetical protein
VTNHAIVAMIGDDVKQTRCTTCDSEHAYKGGREPRRRKKDAPATLYREVLAGMQESDVPAAAAAAAAEDAASPALVPAVAVPPSIPEPTEVVAETSPIAEQPALADAEHADSGDDVQPVEEGPVHRRLIRATLPRPDGAAKETRPIPEFTMRHNGRNGQFRGGQFRGAGNGNGNGHRPPGRRFAGGGANSQSNRGGQGRGGGFRGGPHPQRSGGGGKKRSR